MPFIEVANTAKIRFAVAGGTANLLVTGIDVSERISAPFEATVGLACEEDVEIESVVGREAVLTLKAQGADRFLHGIVSRFVHTGSKARFRLYRATVVPTLWLLGLRTDCRIFQQKTVPDIVEEVLKGAGFAVDRYGIELQGNYAPREYCVQYRESDLDFVSRLLEEEGIFYFFEHLEDKHVLVLGDAPGAYRTIPGNATLAFHPPDQMVPDQECVFDFELGRGLHSTRVTHRDFNFERPLLDLTASVDSGHLPPTEFYDYPGRYEEHGRGEALARAHLEAVTALHRTAEGKGLSPRFAPGSTFTLSAHPAGGANRDHLLVSVRHTATQPQVLEELAPKDEIFRYANTFVAVPADVPYRPPRSTPRPVVEGIETALVVGPQGEEIFTDQYGRIKVQFHWDRLGKRDEKSSCWVRVASNFAGPGYGAIFLPRVGHEVVVDFIGGDPDRPLVTSAVYNAANRTPYTLPDDRTKSTIKTRSSPGGDGFNEIRFEDLKGKEQIYVHAQGNFDLRVETDQAEDVGQDRKITVKRDEQDTVGQDRHTSIGRDELREVKRDENVTITGKQAISVKESRSVTVEKDVIETYKSNHTEETTKTIYLKGLKVVVEGMEGLTLKCGGSFITVNSAGVSIVGPLISLNSGGAPLLPPVLQAVLPALPVVGKLAEGPVADHQPEKTDWIEIELKDDKGQPVTGARYRVTAPDGSVHEGTTGHDGSARVEHLDPGSCKVTFPDYDKDLWEPA